MDSHVSYEFPDVGCGMWHFKNTASKVKRLLKKSQKKIFQISRQRLWLMRVAWNISDNQESEAISWEDFSLPRKQKPPTENWSLDSLGPQHCHNIWMGGFAKIFSGR